MLTVKDNYSVEEVEVKRFYLPCNMYVECPKCEKTHEYNQYVSYPKVNKTIELNLYCPECEHEWTEEIKIVLGVEIPADVKPCTPDVYNDPPEGSLEYFTKHRGFSR